MPPRFPDDDTKPLTAGDRMAMLKALQNNIIGIGGFGGMLLTGLAAISIPKEVVMRAEGYHLANTGKVLTAGVGSRPVSEMFYVGGQMLFALIETRPRWWWLMICFLLPLAIILDMIDPTYANIKHKWKYAYLVYFLGSWLVSSLLSYISKAYALSGSVASSFMLLAGLVEAIAVFVHSDIDSDKYINAHNIASMLYGGGVIAIVIQDITAKCIQRYNGFGKPADTSSSSTVE